MEDGFEYFQDQIQKIYENCISTGLMKNGLKTEEEIFKEFIELFFNTGFLSNITECNLKKMFFLKVFFFFSFIKL